MDSTRETEGEAEEADQLDLLAYFLEFLFYSLFGLMIERYTS